MKVDFVKLENLRPLTSDLKGSYFPEMIFNSVDAAVPILAVCWQIFIWNDSLTGTLDMQQHQN